MTRPVALGFTDGLTPIDELRQRVAAGHHDYAIMLAGGLALSRKTIRFAPGGGWRITNHIDDTKQVLSQPELWSESHIGLALDKRALVDEDGDEGLILVAGEGWRKVEEWLAEVREATPAPGPQTDPLRYVIDGGPGALRMGEHSDVDWEPAEPRLVLEHMAMGPATVAQIDLSAACWSFLDEGCPHAATTSIELTIEEVDGLIATLTAIREHSITRRGFRRRERDGLWTNGEE